MNKCPIASNSDSHSPTLVLMEDGLGPENVYNLKPSLSWVLILVLMEDGLGHTLKLKLQLLKLRLNPCFNGRWSRTTYRGDCLTDCCLSLNPCFNGRWSRTTENKHYVIQQEYVLILVLMEDGLGQSQA